MHGCSHRSNRHVRGNHPARAACHTRETQAGCEVQHAQRHWCQCKFPISHLQTTPGVQCLEGGRCVHQYFVFGDSGLLGWYILQQPRLWVHTHTFCQQVLVALRVAFSLDCRGFAKCLEINIHVCLEFLPRLAILGLTIPQKHVLKVGSDCFELLM